MIKESKHPSGSSHQTQNSLKNKRFRYKIIPSLLCVFLFLLAFQNCDKKPNKGIGPQTSESPSPLSSPSPATSGDKATLKISSKYGGAKSISHIVWRSVERDSCTKRTIATHIGETEEVTMDWTSLKPADVSAISKQYIDALILFTDSTCKIYRQQSLKWMPSNASTVTSSTSTSCQNDDISSRFRIIARLPAPPNPLQQSISSAFLAPTVNFPINMAIELYLISILPDDMADPLPDTPYTWSIKKITDDTELADQTQTNPHLTHAFTEIGLYNISVTTTYTDEDGEKTLTIERELLVGECENAEAIEVVVDANSFGSQTPADLGPVWNYVRPFDTNTVNVELIRISDSDVVYKYKRDSTSKFLDIDIQNADECFFDDQPDVIRHAIACDPDTPNCGINYQMRNDVTALPSCTGKAFEMATLDTDQTTCSYDVFVLAARQTGKDRIQQTFVKVCSINDAYCYFGPKSAFDRAGIFSATCTLPTIDPTSTTTTSSSTSSTSTTTTSSSTSSTSTSTT